MTRSKIEAYYRETKDSGLRPELEFALEKLDGGIVAVDCGCGSGANIVHLRNKGFVVHAYDIDKDAVSICTKRFIDDDKVFVSTASFGTFDYPKSSLVLADASLFFCAEQEFDTFVDKIEISLHPKGIFCGAFLGEQDTMAQPGNRDQVYWGKPLVKSQNEIREALSGFEILRMSEVISDGVTPDGNKHQWHIHIVVARLIKHIGA